MRQARALRLAIPAAMLVSCTAVAPGGEPPSGAPPAASGPPGTPGATPARPQPEPSFDAAAAMRTVRTLAALGPREATGAAYGRAAGVVEDRLRALGYAVRRQSFEVPRGISWGIRVPEGKTANLIAEPDGFDPAEPHVVVGAHLDTVPQSPGANDNASGVAVMLELARLARADAPPVPVVFVAFGAEEPRGAGDARHHYGSRRYLAGMDDGDALVGMMSLDRVGVGRRLRVCTGGSGTQRFARTLLRAAARIGVPAVPCRNRASDHWSFEKAGHPAARLLGADDPHYHTPRDRPEGVARPQLRRAGLLAWEALRTLQADL